MNLRRRLRGESVTDTSLLSPPSSAALLLAGNSSADTESSAGAESDSEWTYLLTTDDQLNQSVRKEFYYDHVSVLPLSDAVIQSVFFSTNENDNVLGLAVAHATTMLSRQTGCWWWWYVSKTMLQGTLVVDCQAPSSSLAMSLLRLHSDHQTCGHVILRLVQLLSLRLKATISDIAVDHSLLVQSVISLYLCVCLSSCIQCHGSVFQTWAELCSNSGFWVSRMQNPVLEFGFRVYVVTVFLGQSFCLVPIVSSSFDPVDP